MKPSVHHHSLASARPSSLPSVFSPRRHHRLRSPSQRRAILFVLLLSSVLCQTATAKTYLGTPGGDRFTGRPYESNLMDGDGGQDRLIGGLVNDSLQGGPGGDRIFGRSGDDAIDGFSGDDKLYGNSGHDNILGDFGRDRIIGGSGNDVIDTGGAGDYADGGAGDDIVHGGGGIDVIRGGSGNDRMYPDTGPDELDAGDGDDIVYVNHHQKVGPTDCGAGFDTVYITPSGTTGGQSPHMPGRIQNCERWIEAEAVVDPTMGIKANAYAPAGETLYGTELRDQLTGASGPDRLFALGGDDVLWGNRLPTGPSYGTDILDGGAGNDRMWGSRGKNIIRGGPGDDYIQGGPKRNRIDGGDGSDTIRFTAMHRASSIAFGGSGDDIVHAYGRGPLDIRCGPGDDTVKISLNRYVKTKGCEHVLRRR